MKESPTAHRRALGRALRQLRDTAGKTTQEAAELLECSESKIRKIEYGDVPTKVAERKALLEFYGASPDDFTEIQELAKGANQPGWWQEYRGAVPRWFQRFVGLESAAREIWTFETELIPGLLQTAGYTRAVIDAGNPEMAASEVEQRLKVRAERQRRLFEDSGARLLAVMSEAAIRRVVGGPAVMSDQLRVLLQLPRAGGVQLEIQVVPFSAGAHPATGFPFTLLRFPHDAAVSLAYTESLTSAVYHDRQAELATYSSAFDRLRAVALSPVDSAAVIQQAVDELSQRKRGTE